MFPDDNRQRPDDHPRQRTVAVMRDHITENSTTGPNAAPKPPTHSSLAPAHGFPGLPPAQCHQRHHQHHHTTYPHQLFLAACLRRNALYKSSVIALEHTRAGNLRLTLPPPELPTAESRHPRVKQNLRQFDKHALSILVTAPATAGCSLK